MLITPDYGLSDIWHFNYPLKNLLSESFKQGKLPLWTDMIGNGFPIAAEGQIGIFSPLNWLIFGLLPMPQAFTAAQLLTFAIAFTGSYFLIRKTGLSKALSAAGALFASFNGYFIVQLTHLNLLQSFSFIPWALLFTEKFITEKNHRSVLWLGFTLAQMILVGYPQTFINTLLILVIYSTVRNWNKKVSNFIKIMAGAVIAVLLSAIQIIPLFELVKQSAALSAAAGQRYIHPLPIKHLLSVFYPFMFGDPSKGTYPYYGRGWPIFWENLLYIGIVPLVILLINLINRKQKVKQKISPVYKPITAILVVSILFALGKATPVGLLFKLPPLSFTRIESRFLAFSNISLGLLAGFGLIRLISKVSKNLQTIIVVIVVLLHLFQISWTFRNYHLWGSDALWLDKPETAIKLPAGSRIVSINQEKLWQDFDASHGWQNKEETIRSSREMLGPNSNLIFGVKQLGVYVQQYPKRFDAFRHYIYGNDELGKNIRDVFGVTHVIDATSGKVEVRENFTALADVRIGRNLIKVRDMGEALGRMNQSVFDPQTDVLWEAETMPSVDEEVVVVNRSYYPGWKAFLSEKEIPVYPVNINQQAVIAPKDTEISKLAFKYDPLSYKIGGGVSGVSLIIWLVFLRRFSVQYYGVEGQEGKEILC